MSVSKCVNHYRCRFLRCPHQTTPVVTARPWNGWTHNLTARLLESHSWCGGFRPYPGLKTGNSPILPSLNMVSVFHLLNRSYSRIRECRCSNKRTKSADGSTAVEKAVPPVKRQSHFPAWPANIRRICREIKRWWVAGHPKYIRPDISVLNEMYLEEITPIEDLRFPYPSSCEYWSCLIVADVGVTHLGSVNYLIKTITDMRGCLMVYRVSGLRRSTVFTGYTFSAPSPACRCGILSQWPQSSVCVKARWAFPRIHRLWVPSSQAWCYLLPSPVLRLPGQSFLSRNLPYCWNIRAFSLRHC